MERGAALNLPTKSKPAVMISAFVLTLVIGSADYLTGRDFAVSSFYLIPICWAGWKVGRKAGILLAVLSVVVWFVADKESGFVYQHALTPYWNALMLLVLFLVVAWLLSAFQEAHYHLEEAVQNRTAALQAEITERKRLEMAKLQAERLAAVGAMAAQVAHEVRNPLGSITLNLDLIKKEIDKLAGTSTYSPQEGNELLTDMRAEVHRIQRVIEEYLRFARFPKLNRASLALNDFLEKKLAFMNAELEKAKIELKTGFDPMVEMVNCDGEQLWQAILNLIRNSKDAMPEGGKLTVATWREGGQLRLRITDSGKGMNEEQLRKVFAPFFTTKPQGTGLGLTLVQQIVSEHGGHIECDSLPGKGTTFTILLPIAEKS